MLRIPDNNDPTSLTDWVETSLLCNGNNGDRVTDTEIINVIERADISDSDLHLANIRNEVSSRSRMLSTSYPVRRDGRGFSRTGRWENFLPYSFLLLVSLNQAYAEMTFSGGTANKPAELFEDVTSVALGRYIRGEAFRLGAPRRRPVPGGFPEAVKFAAATLNEDFQYGGLEWQQSGDDGVDVIAWLPFQDKRPSQLILLAQCAIGTDWRGKRSELELAVWRYHIRWHSEPIKVFAVPFHHEPGGSWRETAARGGIILDRIRLVSLLQDSEIAESLTQGITRWCTARLREARQLRL